MANVTREVEVKENQVETAVETNLEDDQLDDVTGGAPASACMDAVCVGDCAI